MKMLDRRLARMILFKVVPGLRVLCVAGAMVLTGSHASGADIARCLGQGADSQNYKTWSLFWSITHSGWWRRAMTRSRSCTISFKPS